MGFFSNLLSMSGGGKIMAAQNALAAKYLIEEMIKANDEHLTIIDETISRLLISGGISPNDVDRFKKSLDEGAYYGMAAIALYNLNQPPPFRGLFFRDQWNSISNPLVALAGAGKEIQMVHLEIRRKFGIAVDLAQ
jgi:hypothetical protein